MARKVKMRGPRRAAALLVALGQDQAALVMAQLPDEDVGRLAWLVAGIEKLEPEQREDLYYEFYSAVTDHEHVTHGGPEAAFDLLERAFGEERARELQMNLGTTSKDVPFAFLKNVDADVVAGFMREEHPQAIAMALAMLPDDYAASLLMNFKDELQVSILSRLAGMERADAEAIELFEDMLRKRAGNLLDVDSNHQAESGTDQLVSLLRIIDTQTGKWIIDGIDEIAPTIGALVRQQMFMFENIASLDDRAIQRVLRDVDQKDLALSMRAATDEVKERLYANMSSRGAAMLREDMEASGKVRMVLIHEAQGRIVAVVMQLEEADEIVINRGGTDEMVG
ncbi:MAG: flagellar motor switch protein FliG [Dehalococcoidia bacterium]|jgi:flagellar motor switch protein FliG|nr:flagellar motor switch protein FliG [Dehalococcoidia bacterium]